MQSSNTFFNYFLFIHKLCQGAWITHVASSPIPPPPTTTKKKGKGEKEGVCAYKKLYLNI